MTCPVVEKSALTACASQPVVRRIVTSAESISRRAATIERAAETIVLYGLRDLDHIQPSSFHMREIIIR
jgi:hypothetical protein